MNDPHPARTGRSRRSPARRVLLGVAVGIGALLLSAVLGALIFVLWVRTDAGNDWLEMRIERLVNAQMEEGRFEIGELDTDAWSRLRAEQIVLSDADGEPVVYIEQLAAEMGLLPLLARRLSLPHVRAEGILVDLEEGPDGLLNIARMFGAEPDEEEKPFEGLPLYLDLPDVRLYGANVRYRTPDGVVFHLVAANLSGGVEGQERVELRDLVLDGQLVDPGLLALVLRGDLAYDVEGLHLDDVRGRIPHGRVTADGLVGDDGLDVVLDVPEVALEVLRPVADGAEIRGTWSLEGTVQGPWEALQLDAQAEGLAGTRGGLALSATLDTTASPLAYEGRATVRTFHVGDAYEVDEEIVLDGVLSFDGRGLSFPGEMTVEAHFVGQEQRIAGQVFERVDVEARLEGGVLHVTRGDVTGIVGNLRASGTIDLVDGPMDLLVSGTLEPTRLDALGLEGFATTGTFEVRATGNVLRTDTVPIRLRGTVRWSPFGFDGMATFDRLVADFDARVFGEDVRGTAVVRGEGLESLGATVEVVRSTNLAFHVTPEGVVTVEGVLDVTGLVYDPAIAVPSAIVDLDVLMDGDHRDIEALVRFDDHELFGRPGTEGRAEVDLEDELLAFRFGTEDYGREVLDTVGVMNLDTSRVRLEGLRWAPTPRASWVTPEPVEFLITEEGGIAEADIELVGNLGVLRLQGRIGTEGPLDATILLERFQLDALAELFPDELGGLAGELDLRATLAGTASDPVLDATLDLDGFFLEDTFRWLDVEGELHGEDGRLQTRLSVGVAGEGLAQVSGFLPVELALADLGLRPEGPVDLHVAVVPGSYQRFEYLLPSLEEGDLPQGRISAVLELQGALVDPELRLAGVSEVDIEQWTRPGRIEWDLRRDGDDLAFWADLREGLEARASITGGGETRMGEVFAWALGERAEEPDLDNWSLWLDQMAVDLVLLGVPVESLARLADDPVEVEGELVGGFRFTGDPLAPTIEGGAHWIDARIGERALDGAFLALTPAETGYDLQLSADFEGTGGLTVAGRVPIEVDLRVDPADWTKGELDLAVSGEGLPLDIASAIDPGVRATEGLVDIQGTIGGSVTDPVADLTATLEDGALTYAPLGLRLTDIDLVFQADGRRLRLERFSAVTAPVRGFRTALQETGGTPRVLATGTAQLEGGTLSALSAQIQLRNGVWLSATDDATVRVEGALQVSGAYPALEVVGELDLVQGRVNLDAAAFLEATPLVPDPDLVIVRGERQVEEREPPEPEPPFYSAFEVDIDLDLNRNLELELSLPFIDDLGALGAAVARVDANARLGGQLDVRMSGGEPSLVGEVDVIGGKVRTFRSNFDLQEGTITFTGADPTNPVLDLRAQMQITDATVDMSIQGTPDEPEIDFASEQYPDDTQIMTILLTGQSPERLTSTEGAGSAEALAGLLLNSLFAGQSLGSLTVEPDGAVRVGIPVSSSLYAASLLDPNAGPDENTFAFQLDWSVLPQVVLSGAVGDQRSWGDVFWEIRF